MFLLDSNANERIFALLTTSPKSIAYSGSNKPRNLPGVKDGKIHIIAKIESQEGINSLLTSTL